MQIIIAINKLIIFPLIFFIALLLVGGISLGTLFWQINKIAYIDPAKIMKTE